MAVIREKRQFKIGPVGVARASEGGRIVGQAISQAADQATDIFFREGLRQAEKKGEEAAKSVTREAVITIDPNTRQPQAYQVPEGFGRAATEAYQRVVLRRFEQSIGDEMQNKAKELSAKYEGNPNSVALYEKSMSDYIAAMSNVAEGQFKGYIQDTGSAYLNATKTNLEIAKVRQERAAAAKAQAQAVENGLENIEALVTQLGPSAILGPTQTNAIIQSVGQTVDDGVQSGLFDQTATASMGERGQLAVTRGLLRYAASQTSNPEELELLQHAVGTQNPSAVPAKFSYVADAMREFGSNFSALSELEKFSDGLISDQIQIAQVLQSQRIREQEQEEARSVFDLKSEINPTKAHNTNTVLSGKYSASDISTFAIQGYNSSSLKIREANLSGQDALADQLAKNRDAALSGTVEGLMLKSLEGLSRTQTDQLEAAIFARDVNLAPQSSQDELQAIFRLNNQVNPKIIDEYLPFIGSYRDAAGKFVEVKKQNKAFAQVSNAFDEDIAAINTLRGDLISSEANKIIGAIGLVEDLDGKVKEDYISNINFRAGQAFISQFFEMMPTKEQVKDASTYLAGGAATVNLTEQQIQLLNQASEFGMKSGKEGQLRTHFNTNESAHNSRLANNERQVERQKTFQRLLLNQGDPSSVSDRRSMEEFLSNQFSEQLGGRDLSTVWSDSQFLATDEGQLILNATGQFNVMPQSLHESLSSLANGAFLGGDISTLLSIYGNYRDYSYGVTTMRSPMIQSMEESEIAALDYMIDLMPVIGSDPDAIARVFSAKSELERNPAYKERVEAFLGSSVEEYVSGLNGISDAPLGARSALTATTLELFSLSQSSGLTKRQLTKRLERQIERTYPTGDGIVIGPNGASRTIAPISYAAPNNEDLFRKHVINKATLADPNGPTFMLGLEVESVDSTGRVTYKADEALFLKPIGMPSQGEVRYVVYRNRPIEEGGPTPVMETKILPTGRPDERRSVSVPLVVSNRDQEFLDSIQFRSSSENSDSISTAIKRFGMPRGVPNTQALGGAAIIGQGGGNLMMPPEYMPDFTLELD